MVCSVQELYVEVYFCFDPKSESYNTLHLCIKSPIYVSFLIEINSIFFVFISLFGYLVFLEKYYRIFICILYVWLIGHKQVRNFSHNFFLLLFIWRHFLSCG